jgi:apolipoprotein D and lipocalin family protein
MMKTKKILLSALLLAPLSFLGCESYRNSDTALGVVEDVDLERYQGLWHEVARFPTRFQSDCERSTALYELQEDQSLKVTNTCIQASGETRQIEGKAYLKDESEPAKFRVRFDPFPARLFPGNYWVIELGPDYEYAVVSEPKGRYLWILSRTPQPDELLVQDLVKRLQDKGFETERLIFAPDVKIYSRQ